MLLLRDIKIGLTGFPRPDLIDKEIERAVALMQSVVETGRYIRDRVVVPIKVTTTDIL